MIELSKIKAIIENLLLISNKSLTISNVSKVLDADGVKVSDVVKAFSELVEEYSKRNVQILQVDGGFRLATKFEYSDWVKRFKKYDRKSTLSKSALETLSIIAYKQPITRVEVDTIRGVDSGGTIRMLLEKKLIKMAGKKDVLGKPMMYGTSKKFLEYFGLLSLSDLPSLKEFSEKEFGENLNESDEQKKQLQFPLGGKASESDISSRDSIKEEG